MIDAVKPDDNQRARRQISTPTDSSCTHILVFPTSATAQVSLQLTVTAQVSLQLTVTAQVSLQLTVTAQVSL